MNTISRGIRNAFRNGIRTFSIVIILGLSIGLALAMLISRQAVEKKIADVKGSIGNLVTISPAGSRGFEGGGEPLTNDQMAKVKALPHVVNLTTTFQDQLASGDTNLQSAIEAGSLGQRRAEASDRNLNSNLDSGERRVFQNRQVNFTPPITAIGTNNVTTLQAFGGGGTITVKDGGAFDPNVDKNVALIGTDLAAKNNLGVGSTFKAYGTDITVTGTFDSGNKFSNSVIVMPLSTLQRLSNQTSSVSSAVVQVDSISNLDSAVSAIKSTLGDSADVVNQQDTSAEALAPLESIKNVSLYSLIGAVGAGAVIILLTMLMIVRERRREVGVLKAIGSSNLGIMLQFMTEALTLTILAAALGIGLGVAGSNPISKMLVNNSASASPAIQAGPGGGGAMVVRGGGAVMRFANQSFGNLKTIQTDVGWNILLDGLGTALVIALIGSAVPAWFIAKIRPAEVMRSE